MIHIWLTHKAALAAGKAVAPPAGVPLATAKRLSARLRNTSTAPDPGRRTSARRLVCFKRQKDTAATLSKVMCQGNAGHDSRGKHLLCVVLNYNIAWDEGRATDAVKPMFVLSMNAQAAQDVAANKGRHSCSFYTDGNAATNGNNSSRSRDAESADEAQPTASCLDQRPAAKRPRSPEPGIAGPSSAAARSGRPRILRTGMPGRPRKVRPTAPNIAPLHHQQCPAHSPALQQHQQDPQPAMPPAPPHERGTAGWAADWCWTRGCSQPAAGVWHCGITHATRPQRAKTCT